MPCKSKGEKDNENKIQVKTLVNYTCACYGDSADSNEAPVDNDGGLGVGAIIGIVVGSVAVVGIGGFAIFWFVIKKKNFADLIAVFKK